ncbi:VWA domain-containing protein [Robertkochia solimangrovi]|uniref:VWA domain-containing protein n=1 Tax=Robertkochia solimangrovi TaxID=2213046 RepID=UPI00117BEE07|nr:VWA domain-containing protein [Robertkochia solimangrovi]TRZ42058.1 magnesium chelatase [Robertkochia solimangrovi]
MNENFELLYPWIFVLLPFPLLVYWLLPPLHSKSTSIFYPTFSRMVSYTGAKPRKAAEVRRRKFLNWIVLYLCWALLLFALSSPQLTGEPKMKVKTSRSFLIAADISNSMSTSDWVEAGRRVRRWDGVKSVLQKFIDDREGDRMGLIFFGSAAYIQAPFTPDLKTVNHLMEETDVGMAGQLTHIGKAITKGMSMFEKDTLKSRVMLLLTDGVDAGDDIQPIDAANMAAKDSVVIYTLGIGEPGTSGSDLDERTLRQISEVTGGKYFLAKDQNELEKVYEELDKLEPIEYEEEENRPVTLLYMYPLSGVLLLLFISWMINQLVMFWQAFRQSKYNR